MHRLQSPYKCARSKGARQLLKSEVYTHICVLCLDKLSKRPHITGTAWEAALFRMDSVSNAKKHITRRHKEILFAKQEIASDLARSEAFLTHQDDMGKRSGEKRQKTLSSSTIQPLITDAMRPNDDMINAHVFHWLVEDGLPFYTVSTPAFEKMLRGVANNQELVVLYRDKYNKLLDGEFSLFTKYVAKLLKDESSHALGYRFLTVLHDIWTNKSKDSIVGASISFIDHKWRYRNIAVLAEVKNDGHVAESVAHSIQERCMARFGVDIVKLSKYTASDTANAARKVSEYFGDTEQVDCSMHILNLCIGYGLGMKENTRTVSVYDRDGRCYRKVVEILTPSGPFPEGAMVIRKLRALNNFFSNGERRSKLAKIQEGHCYPTTKPMVDVDVRVASSCRLLRRSILNFAAFRAYFSGSESNAFDCITTDEWKLAAEMEAITNFISELALVETQKAGLVASYVAVFRKMAEDGLNGSTFKVCRLGEPPNERTTDDTQPRQIVPRSEISSLGMACVARTLAQLQERFPPLSAELVMLLLLDPRTKNCVRSIVVNMGSTETRDQYVNDGTKLLYDRHAGLYEKQQRELRGFDDVPIPPTNAALPYVDVEMLNAPEAYVFGAPIAMATKTDIEESRFRGESDAIVKRWLGENVNWVKVANKQHETDDIASHDYTHELMAQGGSSAYWNLAGLFRYVYVDILAWFRDVGEKEFPSIALLARIWLAKAASTAYQERVFSTGGIVMGEKRTQTDAARAEKQLLLRHNRLEVVQMHAFQ